MATYKIGIDLGGTKTESIVLAPDDTVLNRTRVPTPRDDGYDAIVDCLSDIIRTEIRHLPPHAACSVGMGIPGSINRESRLVQNANTTCLIGKPLQHDMEKRLERSINIENDANCFTLAESRCGAARGYGFVFGVIMGTGCGGGICINGSIRTGAHGLCGEWGHIAVDPQGRKCYCGKQGCVETKISGEGVEASFLSRYGTRRSMRDIVRGYRDHEPACVEAFTGFLDDFGRCLGGVISILDPDVVVLGGGLSNIEELYSLGAKRVRRYAFHDHLTTPILKNRLGDSAGVFGAAWTGSP